MQYHEKIFYPPFFDSLFLVDIVCVGASKATLADDSAINPYGSKAGLCHGRIVANGYNTPASKHR